MNRWLVLGASLASLLGCMPQYKHPTADQPHSIIKFRRTYDSTPGTTLSEVLVVDDTKAFGTSSSSAQGDVPRTDAVLLHPGSAAVELRAAFTHQESYTTQQSYSCGTQDSPRTCYRPVNQTRTVTDGACRKKMTIRFHEGRNYLLSLTYQDSRNCSASCFIQEPLGGESSRIIPARWSRPSTNHD